MNTEKHHRNRSLLQKWGKKVTSRLYEANSPLTGEQKKAIVAILHRIGNPDQDNIFKWSPVPGKLKIVLCFPYALGFACEEGKISTSLIDLRKPILIITTSNHCFTHLEKHLSTDLISGSKPYFLTQGFLTANDINEGAHYHTFTIKNDTDAVNVASLAGRYDIILTNFQYCMALPDDIFSIVLVYGNRDLSPGQQHSLQIKFAEQTQIVLFTTPPMTEQQEDCNSEETTLTYHSQYRPKYSISKLVKHAQNIIRTERIRSQLNKRQLSVLWKIIDKLDSEHENAPLVVSMKPGMGEIEMLCFLPYFLGKASTIHKGINLSKPILIIVPNIEAMATLKKHLRNKPYLIQSGYLRHEEIADKALYRTHVVEDNFDAVTITKVNNTHEIVLSAKEHYQCLPTDNFSVVVVHESNLLSRQIEKDITSSFEKAKIILFRVASDETAEKFADEVRSRLEYLQQGQESFVPVLVRYGKQMKERLFNDAILTEQQLLGLRAMVDWFVYPDSKHQPARIDSTIKHEEAGAMVCCLPYMFGWAVSSKLIDAREMDLHKPLLVICQSTDTLNQLWNLLHYNPFINNDVTFTDEQSNVLYHSYLFNGHESATDLSDALDINEVVVSLVKHLDKLPENCFSVVISYSFGTIVEDIQNSIIRKFDRYSKLIFINLHSDSCWSESLGHEVPIRCPLLSFGGIVKKERLFGDCSRLNSQEMNALQAVFKWLSDSDTKDLPLVLDKVSHSGSDSIIISCLPYMLGWAIEEQFIPMEEIDLTHKCILVVALDPVALNNLMDILFYPFLVKCGILDPSQVHAGAYYRTKVMLGKDSTDLKTKNQYDIIVTDIKYIDCIAIKSIAFILGYSSRACETSNQTEMVQKLAASAKVKVMFIQGSEIPQSDVSNQYTSEHSRKVRAALTKQNSMIQQDGILENHSKFTIRMLNKCNKDMTTSFSEIDHTECTQNKKKKTKSHTTRASLNGPYYKCVCGRELEPSVNHASPYTLPGTIPILAMSPNCTFFPQNVLPTKPYRENDCSQNLPMTKSCREKDSLQNLLKTRSHQENGHPSNFSGNFISAKHYQAHVLQNDSPQYLQQLSKCQEGGMPQDSVLTKTRQESYFSTRASNFSLQSLRRVHQTSRTAVRAAGKETQTNKISRTYYLKRVNASQNSKGNQARIESVQCKPKLYRYYGSKYYKQLENASGFRRSFVSEPQIETPLKSLQILVRNCEDSEMAVDEDSQVTINHQDKLKVGKESETLSLSDAITRRKTLPLMRRMSKQEISDDTEDRKLKQCNTIQMSDLAAIKENMTRDETSMRNAFISLEDKMIGVDKSEQEQQVENILSTSTGQGVEMAAKLTCDEQSLLHGEDRIQEMTKAQAKFTVCAEPQVRPCKNGILRRKTLPITCTTSKEQAGAEDGKLKHCKTMQMSDLSAIKENRTQNEMDMKNGSISLEDKSSSLEQNGVKIKDESLSNVNENGLGTNLVDENSKISLTCNDLKETSNSETTCDEQNVFSIDPIRQTFEDNIQNEKKNFELKEQTSRVLIERFDTDRTQDVAKETTVDNELQQENPNDFCDNHIDEKMNENEILLVNKASEQRSNSVDLLKNLAFLVLYNQLKERACVKLMDGSKEDKDLDKNTLFHLVEFLNENKDKIKMFQRTTSGTPKGQHSHHSEFELKHFSDNGYNEHLQMEFRENRQDDTEICDSVQEIQEVKETSSEQINLNQYKSQSETTRPSEILPSTFNNEDQEHLLSTEILALRTLDDSDKQSTTLPQHQSMEKEMPDKCD